MANSPMGMDGVPFRRRTRPPGLAAVALASAIRALAVGTLVIGLGLPGPLAAQEKGDESPEALAGEAVDRLMRALDLLIGAIPQFEAPYINENGDIIIRRKHGDDGGSLPTPEEKPTPPGGPDTTTT